MALSEDLESMEISYELPVKIFVSFILWNWIEIRNNLVISRIELIYLQD